MSTVELEALVAELRELIVVLRASQADLQATIDALNVMVAVKDQRIGELEAMLDEQRRAGKRQAAPFSKGSPSVDPKTPGRKPGVAYGAQAGRPRPERVARIATVLRTARLRGHHAIDMLVHLAREPTPGNAFT